MNPRSMPLQRTGLAAARSALMAPAAMAGPSEERGYRVSRVSSPGSLWTYAAARDPMTYGLQLSYEL